MCRRELPTSAGAVPAWMAARSKTSRKLPELPSIGGQRAERRRSSPCAAAGCDLKALPSRLANQIRSFTRAGVVPASQFKDILACAEALGSALRCQLGHEWSDASSAHESAVVAQRLLSDVAARSMAEMSMDDLNDIASGCAVAIQHEDLLGEQVCEGLRTALMRSVQVCSSDALPDAVTIRWHEAKAFVAQLVFLGSYECFQPLVTEMFPYATRQVFDIIKLSSLEDLPAALRRGQELLKPWPVATFGLTAVLRDWLPTRLRQVLARLCSDGEASPTLPLPAAKGSPQRKGKLPAWKRMVWWLDVLRLVSMAGLVESSMLQDFCNELAPRLSEEGIKVASAQAVLLQTAGGQSVQSIGDSISPRFLASELFRRPAMVRYMPNVQIILLNCPGDDDGSQPIVLSDSSDAPPHSSRSAPTPRIQHRR